VSDPRSACKAALQLYKTEIPMDVESTWVIWRGAVAVDAMCVRRGLSGVFVNIGKSTLCPRRILVACLVADCGIPGFR